MALNNQFPSDQYFIAMLLTALRCLDDPRHGQLVNYDAMLYEVDLKDLTRKLAARLIGRHWPER